MSKTPNIVLIMPDQQRWDSLACAGNGFTSTPHVDRLATSGVRFTHGYTSWPVCTPARGTMWTGVFTHIHDLEQNVYKIDDAIQSISGVKTTVFDLLKAAGYTTAHFGKWHLGEAQPAFFDHWERSFNSRFHHWVDGKPEGQYRPDLQTDACVAWLKQHADRNGGPFAMVQGYYPPHDPFTAPERFVAPYRAKGVPFAGYYGAVSAIDHCTGRILDALEETGLRENTMVIYFSDHGETFKGRDDGEHKFVCFDEAIRIPYIVSWPGGLPAGAVCDAPVGLEDLMPTALDYTGVDAPEHLQGRSLRPLLEGGAAADWRDGYFLQNRTFVRKIEQRCLREADWKLIGAESGKHFLFDLRNDQEEEFNLFLMPQDEMPLKHERLPGEAAAVAEGLATRMKARAEELKDPKGVEIASRVLETVGRVKG